MRDRVRDIQLCQNYFASNINWYRYELVLLSDTYKIWVYWIPPLGYENQRIWWACFLIALLFHNSLKGVLHPWTLFLKTLCIFSKNKATSNKVSYGSGQKCSKELKNHSFTSVETIVVKSQWKMCENQYFPCFEP